ncbi:MAG TPA: metallophosphoesterase [Bryobacteraceae bacterium]|jgi:tartrate-resistant acid phosphatase type 5|nr:metallophosphoesterase [Bryobacteraceae bacterium]
MLRQLLVLMVLPLTAGAQKFYTYVGQIGMRSVLLAWGTAAGPGNTIGRTSSSRGRASLTVGPKTEETDRNWAVIDGLEPDTPYAYHVVVKGQKIGEGRVRTYPERADKLAFFVIGDYGNGAPAQYAIAKAMSEEAARRRDSDNPVRFVLTTGDNIYADGSLGFLSIRSGDADRHWERKFFQPYEKVIAEIPFYPTLGNHDGNASENRGDLWVYLDNFFFPRNKPARWYTFSFGGLADFFALDTTDITERGLPRAAYTAKGEQFVWLKKAMADSKAPWKIPYFHHPPFNAGPGHPASLDTLRHFVDLFTRSGVKVVLSGHEHNFQFSTQDQATGGACYVISGAGGQLRPGNVTRYMGKAHIAGWAAQHHFLVVEIRGDSLSITPVSYEPMNVTDPNGKTVELPIGIRLP